MSTEPLHLEPETRTYETPEQDFADSLAVEQDTSLSIEATTLAGAMGRVQARLEAEMQNMETTGVLIARATDAITPTDQASYAELCERMGDNDKFLKGVEAFIDPWRTLFYRPYQAVLARLKLIVTEPAESLKNGKNRRLAFEREVRAAADRETMRLQDEQRRREEEQRLTTAVTAEGLGVSDAGVETILTQPSTMPLPVAAPQIARPLGVRKIAPNWQAELVSKPEFWKWARQQKEMPACLLIDGPTMNREAKTHKATLAQRFPGFRGVNRGGE